MTREKIDQCPKCGSTLIIPGQALTDYPSGSEYQLGSIAIRLVCADGCGYDCYDTFTFRRRLDEDHPNG
jgi:hypothetical protein